MSLAFSLSLRPSALNVSLGKERREAVDEIPTEVSRSMREPRPAMRSSSASSCSTEAWLPDASPSGLLGALAPVFVLYRRIILI